jgi:hypothetical protein
MYFDPEPLFEKTRLPTDDDGPISSRALARRLKVKESDIEEARTAEDNQWAIDRICVKGFKDLPSRHVTPEAWCRGVTWNAAEIAADLDRVFGLTPSE